MNAMNKTRVLYPVVWICFIVGVVIGTIGANFVSKEVLQSLGIYRMYVEQEIKQFSILDSNWIFYVLYKRLGFWIVYILFCFTAARWVLLTGSSVIFGCIGATFFVTITRSWGIFSIALFLATVIPHYIAYVIAYIHVMEGVRIWKLANKSLIVEKIMTGSMVWCIGIVCEIFCNPMIVQMVIRLLQL